MNELPINIMVRVLTLVVYFFSLIYWEVAEFITDKKSPKAKTSSLGTKIEIFLTNGIDILCIFQLLGLKLIPFNSGPVLQLIGLVFFLSGIIICNISRQEMGINWANGAEYQIRKDQRLVTSGIYATIRHPIYSSAFLIYTGIELIVQSYLLIFIAPLLILRGIFWAKREEAILRKRFGNAFNIYSKQTKMFIPYIW